MMYILPDILSLIQYKNEVENNPDRVRLSQCVCCGRLNPWLHGTYPRESDRVNPSSTSQNPILIQRYYCPACQKTSSVLPECIPPRRWYLWDMQQLVIFLCAAKMSSAVSTTIRPSRQTISRWFKQFNAQFHLHKDALCGRFAELGRTIGLSDFWQVCLKTLNLGAAMRLCHVAGVSVP